MVPDAGPGEGLEYGHIRQRSHYVPLKVDDGAILLLLEPDHAPRTGWCVADRDVELRAERDELLRIVTDPNPYATTWSTAMNQAMHGFAGASGASSVDVFAQTRAAAVIVDAAGAEQCPVPALVTQYPHACFARVAALLHPEPTAVPGRHPSAVIAADAVIDPSAHIGPQCVIGAGARIGATLPGDISELLARESDAGSYPGAYAPLD